MDEPIADAESNAEEPVSFDPIYAEEVGDRWTEVKFGTEGFSATLYEPGPDGETVVVDEMWLTRDELVEAMADGSLVSLGTDE